MENFYLVVEFGNVKFLFLIYKKMFVIFLFLFYKKGFEYKREFFFILFN